jgi:hypothetical protein
MLTAETQAGTQSITPSGRVYVFVELVIQITFHAFLFQAANGTALFTARFQ